MTALLALMMSLMLTACSAAPVTHVRAAPPPAVSLAELAEEPVRCVVETEVWEDAALYEDGTPLASYRFVLPVLRIVRADGTEVETARTPAEVRGLEVSEAFNQRFAEWAAAREFDGLVQEARATLEWQREEGIPWCGGYTLVSDGESGQHQRYILQQYRRSTPQHLAAGVELRFGAGRVL